MYQFIGEFAGGGARVPNAAFIAGDWGTTHLRLYLCDRQGTVLESKTGKGVGSARGNIEGVFSSLVEDWEIGRGKLPAILCGMVGSTIGWREVPYVACPARLDSIAAKSLRFESGGRAIAIAPGLVCQNRLQAPDMMRGEETQILGALRSDSSLAAGRHLLCMPGTHTKWVSLKDGAVEQFQTALAGELFDILRHYSILVNADSMTEIAGGSAFARALDQTRMFPDAELVHMLFEVRSRQLRGELKREDAAAYLSGLIIGQDVSGAKRLFRAELSDARQVVVIGSSKLGALYAKALEAHDFVPRHIEGEIASLVGLKVLHDVQFKGSIGDAI
jgi:2-dehydro-3-deoxygalactonokinase